MPAKLTAQNQTNIWYFGNQAGIDFSTCNPTPLRDGRIYTPEGVATISDTSGNLLFYTDGIKVWNKLHQVMQNGTGLMGDPSSTQSAIIAPQPGNDSIYYIFTTDAQEAGINGLRYSRVNMRLDAGNGAIIEKNTLLLSEVKEKVTAVLHANRTDIWVVTRVFNSYEYKSWLVSANGIGSPVTSLSPYNISVQPKYSLGYLKISNDGKTIFCGFSLNYYSEIGKFNTQTGEVSQILKFSNLPNFPASLSYQTAYGVEFSPNNKFMYISSFNEYISPCATCFSRNSYIYQYNISLHDSAAIAASAVLIDSAASPAHPNISDLGALQLAKNGKIYIASYASNYLHVINNPDAQGLGCNFQINAFFLNGKIAYYGLPTFIQSYFNPNYKTYDYNHVEDCNRNVSFNLNTTFTYDSLRWDFGDGSPYSVTPSTSHQYISDGLKVIRLFVFNKYGCTTKTDTIVRQVNVGINKPDLGIDRSFCDGDTIMLNGSVTGATGYLWSTGNTDSIIVANATGLYWCQAIVGACVVRDSVYLNRKSLPMVDLGRDTTICATSTITLNAGNAGASYKWQDGAVQQQYIVSKAGVYTVNVTLNGCIAKDSINVYTLAPPMFTLGSDKTFCQGDVFVLRPILDPNWQLQWHDGSTKQTFTVTNPGLYSLKASNICGSHDDEVIFTIGICKVYVPSAFSPNNDGRNDILKVLGTSSITQFNFRIYNRYGQLVFETKKKDEGWNGYFKGLPADMGSYIYQLDYRTLADSRYQKMNGAVLLIR